MKIDSEKIKTTAEAVAPSLRQPEADLAERSGQENRVHPHRCKRTPDRPLRAGCPAKAQGADTYQATASSFRGRQSPW